MHDIRLIRDDPAAFDAALARRGEEAQSGAVLALDEKRRGLVTQSETLLAERNAASKQVGEAKASGDSGESKGRRGGGRGSGSNGGGRPAKNQQEGKHMSDEEVPVGAQADIITEFLEGLLVARDTEGTVNRTEGRRVMTVKAKVAAGVLVDEKVQEIDAWLKSDANINPDVSYVFKGEDEEAVLEALMEADVDVSDIESEDGKITVFAPNTDFFKAKQALQEAFADIDFDVEEIQFIPQNTAPISADDLPMFEKFMDMLNELDDVQNVYHSAELPED